MKLLLQRVSKASVSVDDETVGSIGSGLLLFCGVAVDDTEKQLDAMAEKVSQLRVFPDDKGRFHHSLLEVEGAALVVPQFTLFADTSKGRRPEFFAAMKPPKAKEFFEYFAEGLKRAGVLSVERGVFGASMEVSLVNEGPVTIMLKN